MKTVLFIFCFFFAVSGFSQVEETDSSKTEKAYFDLKSPTGYKLGMKEFTFTPESGRIHIQNMQDSTYIDYADLRRTTDDGLYIMTSTFNDNVSFGRFDSIGNFRSLRYDSVKDSVIEEKYIKGTVKKSDDLK